MRSAAAICRELTADRRTDGELLAAFVAGPAEAAFAELVRRHGPLVWGACRRLLPAPADAEDAFQATFLVLVRRARGLTGRTAFGPWLHRVAVLTARGIRRKSARRLARQSALPDHVPDPAPQPDPDLKADLDAALLALPARFRDPIVLCHLQGFSRREAAERLGCPEGTLSAWLNRGLAKLRVRLGDLNRPKVLSIATASVPAALAASTARAAVATAVAAASVPPTVSVLVEGVLHMFWVKKATAAACALCAVFALGIGAGLSTRTERTGAMAQDKATGAKSEAFDVTKDIAIAEATITFLEVEAKAAAGKTERLSAQFLTPTDPKEQRRVMISLAAAQNEAASVAVSLKAAKDRLTILRAVGKIQVAAPVDREKAIADAEEQVRKVEQKHANVQAAVRAAQQRYELTKKATMSIADGSQKELLDDQLTVVRFRDELDVVTKQLKEARDTLAKLNGTAVKMNTGYLELTVGGKAGEFEFVIRELATSDPKERSLQQVCGPVTTRDPAMLAKLLTRAKNDPAGPQEVRVIAKPTPALGVGPGEALKACDAAGYKTVKFTGYVFQGGFATPLKTNQTGDVAGYKRYDSAEVKPAELLKEIEDGMKRY